LLEQQLEQLTRRAPTDLDGFTRLNNAFHKLVLSAARSPRLEAMLTPLMLELEKNHAGIKVFSLPSVDHPTYGRHIELGVKGSPEDVERAYPAMLAGLHKFDTKLGPELVR
jgi:DNA-binding GntR family transcriptional regulator